ncbi:MAG: SHOCT domain-containing protein [Acetobacterium sp.]
MGFFDLKAVCAVCNHEIGWSRFRIVNKEWICSACFEKCGLTVSTFSPQLTSESLRQIAAQKDNSRELRKTFAATKKIGMFMQFDDKCKQWLVNDGLWGGVGNASVYNYADIIDFELIENEESISKGGLGRAVAGGILFGGVGAVVGGVTGGKKSKAICSNLKLRITVRDMNNPAVYVDFIKTDTKKSSITYKEYFKQAQECVATLQLICEQQAVADFVPSGFSAADEIKKFKNLFDQGIITKEEFDLKKKQLLEL